MNVYQKNQSIGQVGEHHPTAQPPPSREDMDAIFQMCRSDDWNTVLNKVRSNPIIALTPMIMDNHISTTIIHQAITSKGTTAVRAEVISTILRNTPSAASIKNGYGSLPLHVIAQRNTKIDSQTKERLIFELVNAYTNALTQEGGVGKRTPLHIIFTDYISPRLTKMMIDNGNQACFMKDRKGYLPAHVACSRHCSPEKLRMLLAVNPDSLYATTDNGETLLDLAQNTATRSHPNYALIDELKRQIAMSKQEMDDVAAAAVAAASSIGRVSSEEDGSARTRLDSNESLPKTWPTYYSSHHNNNGRTTSNVTPTTNYQTTEQLEEGRTARKRKAEDPAALLLHFSRNSNGYRYNTPTVPPRYEHASSNHTTAYHHHHHQYAAETKAHYEPTEFAEV